MCMLSGSTDWAPLLLIHASSLNAVQSLDIKRAILIGDCFLCRFRSALPHREFAGKIIIASSRKVRRVCETERVGIKMRGCNGRKEKLKQERRDYGCTVLFHFRSEWFHYLDIIHPRSAYFPFQLWKFHSERTSFCCCISIRSLSYFLKGERALLI